MSWNTTEVAFFNLATALLVGIVTYRLNIGKEKRQAIRDFRKKLGTLRSKVERQNEENIADLYHASVPDIQGDVAAIYRERFFRHRLKLAAEAFSGIKRHEINKRAGEGGLGIEFETGRKRILEAIDALAEAL